MLKTRAFCYYLLMSNPLQGSQLNAVPKLSTLVAQEGRPSTLPEELGIAAQPHCGSLSPGATKGKTQSLPDMVSTRWLSE